MDALEKKVAFPPCRLKWKGMKHVIVAENRCEILKTGTQEIFTSMPKRR